jgi:hypothetical protein
VSRLAGPFELDLCTGIDWHAVLTINEGLPQERKVIFEAGRTTAGESRFTIWLNLENDLVLTVTDAAGTAIQLCPVAVPIDELMHLECFASQQAPNTIQLGVCLNGHELATLTTEAVFGSKIPVQNSIGADTNGNSEADFTLAEMAILSPRPVDLELATIHAYFVSAHRVPA